MAISRNFACCFMVVCSMVVVVTLTLTPYVEGAGNCDAVVGNILPCLGYLRSGVGPDGRCCNGVRAINSQAKSTPALQAACRCLISAARSFGIGPTYSAALPGACGVSLPFKTTPNTDCSKIHTTQ